MPSGRTAGRKPNNITPLSPVAQFELPTAALGRPKRKAPFYPYVYMIWAAVVTASLVAIIGAAAWGERGSSDPMTSLTQDPGRTALVGLGVALWAHATWWVWQTLQTGCRPLTKLVALAVMAAALTAVGLAIALASGNVGSSGAELLTAILALFLFSSLAPFMAASHYLRSVKKTLAKRLAALLLAIPLAAVVALFVVAIVQSPSFESLLTAFAASSAIFFGYSVLYGVWLLWLAPKEKRKDEKREDEER